jgi:hypothetical protein
MSHILQVSSNSLENIYHDEDIYIDGLDKATKTVCYHFIHIRYIFSYRLMYSITMFLSKSTFMYESSQPALLII